MTMDIGESSERRAISWLRRGKVAEIIDLAAWAADLERRQAEWRARTPDWRERLAAYGLGPDGEPLAV